MTSARPPILWQVVQALEPLLPDASDDERVHSKPKRKQTTKVVVAKRGNVGRKQTAAKGGRANPKARNSKKRN